MDNKQINELRSTLDLILAATLGVILIITAVVGSIYWKSTKPPPRYPNTLQRDINP